MQCVYSVMVVVIRWPWFVSRMCEETLLDIFYFPFLWQSFLREVRWHEVHHQWKPVVPVGPCHQCGRRR